MIAELLGLGTGTAILRYKQSSLWGVFGFHISAPGNPGNMVSVIWIHALGRLWAFFTPDHLEFWTVVNFNNSKFNATKQPTAEQPKKERFQSIRSFTATIQMIFSFSFFILILTWILNGFFSLLAEFGKTNDLGRYRWQKKRRKTNVTSLCKGML